MPTKLQIIKVIAFILEHNQSTLCSFEAKFQLIACLGAGILHMNFPQGKNSDTLKSGLYLVALNWFS